MRCVHPLALLNDLKHVQGWITKITKCLGVHFHVLLILRDNDYFGGKLFDVTCTALHHAATL